MAPGTAGGGRRAQARAAGGAHRFGGTVEREAVVAPQAARGEEEVQQLADPTSASSGEGGSRARYPTRTPSSASRIASSGAGIPHHRSNDTAPCWTSISPPSVDFTP